jgi:hypothetical protein
MVGEPPYLKFSGIFPDERNHKIDEYMSGIMNCDNNEDIANALLSWTKSFECNRVF